MEEISVIASTPVSGFPHYSLNCIRGVGYCKYLLKYSEEKLSEKLSDQEVIRVEQIRKKIDSVLTPTPLIISFKTQVLPPSLRVAWLWLSVRPYVPSRVFMNTL